MSGLACRPPLEIPQQVSLPHPDRVAHAHMREAAGLAQPVHGGRAQPQARSDFTDRQVSPDVTRPTTTGYRIFLYHYCTK